MSGPGNALIVPTILPNANVHFATVSNDGTAQDVINALLAVGEVQSEILGDLQEHGWALQVVKTAHEGRRWEEDELNALGDGAFLMDSRLPLLIVAQLQD